MPASVKKSYHAIPLLPQALLWMMIAFFSVTVARQVSENALQDWEEARCLANLRNLIQAVHLYADEHEGRLPNAVDNTLPVWRWWTDEVFPYVENVRDFYCPVKAPGQYDKAAMSPLLPVIWDHRLLSYGMNYRMGTAHGRDPGLTMEMIQDPSKLILLAESSHYLVRTHPSMWFQDIAPRHQGAANAAFLDGSVERFPIEENQSPRSGGTGIYDLNLWQIHTR